MSIKSYISQNKTHLMIGLGFALYVGSVIELCKATVKATRKIDKKKREIAEESLVPIEPEDVKIPIKDAVKEVGSLYIPGLSMIAASTGMIGSAIYKIDKDNVGLMTSYLLSQASAENYKEATKEIVGENKEKKIQERAAEISSEKVSPVNPECTGDGNTLYYIPDLLLWLRSSPESVNHGVLEFSKNLIHEPQSVLDLLNALNVYPERYASNDVANRLGWRPEDRLDISVRWRESGSEPCGLLMFSVAPHENFYRYNN